MEKGEEASKNGSKKACPVCGAMVESWAQCCPRCEHEWASTSEGTTDSCLQDFQGLLGTMTPQAWVTPCLIGLNALLFLVMVLGGVHFLSPTTESLVKWGADYGPFTTSGQWWRLVSATFIHVGIIHLLFNMYVLWDIGRLVERLVGNIAFLVLYLIAGVFGSLASVAWNPRVVSAGASGAVFGLFGVLLAFLLRHRHSIPSDVLRKLRNSALAFLGYNLLLGFRPGIDMAAHLGGLLGGFLYGWFAVQPLTPAGAAARGRAILHVSLAAALAILATGYFLPRSDYLELIAVQSDGLKEELNRFANLERHALETFHAGFKQYQEGHLPDSKFAELLEKEVLPGWSRFRRHMAELRNLSAKEKDLVSDLDQYLESREVEWTLFVESIQQQDGKKANLALQAHAKAEQRAEVFLKVWGGKNE